MKQATSRYQLLPTFYAKAKYRKSELEKKELVTVTFTENMDFTNNFSYTIEVHQHFFGSKVTVRAVHGYEYKAVRGYKKTYSTMAEFLNSWTIEQFLPGPVL